jgi:hypothetical protein
MNEPTLVPLVAIRIYRCHYLELMTRYLVRTPEGVFWAFPDEESIRKDPFHADAIRDPIHLEERPQPLDERRLFLYRVSKSHALRLNRAARTRSDRARASSWGRPLPSPARLRVCRIPGSGTEVGLVRIHCLSSPKTSRSSLRAFLLAVQRPLVLHFPCSPQP